MIKKCIFCNKKKQKVIFSSELFYVVRDSYPVTKYHTLIIPNRHVPNFFDLKDKEFNDLKKILKKQRKLLINLDKKISSFNVGVNAGADAGQSIMHCHIHLIPRRKGDIKNPQGGVRGVIPTKQKYTKK
jgi:ATP adenylyltransferase|tara:strand:+ start:412 stop:798 length:387 start_codon:yes stop_codon:yes gene_type:complete